MKPNTGLISIFLYQILTIYNVESLFFKQEAEEIHIRQKRTCTGCTNLVAAPSVTLGFVNGTSTITETSGSQCTQTLACSSTFTNGVINIYIYNVNVTTPVLYSTGPSNTPLNVTLQCKKVGGSTGWIQGFASNFVDNRVVCETSAATTTTTTTTTTPLTTTTSTSTTTTATTTTTTTTKPLTTTTSTTSTTTSPTTTTTTTTPLTTSKSSTTIAPTTTTTTTTPLTTPTSATTTAITTALPTTTKPATTIPTAVLVTTTISCPPGGVWSQWSSNGTCSDTCGMLGYMTQTRTCLSGANGCPCSGASTQQTSYCGPTVCKFPRIMCRASYVRVALNAQFLCVSSAGRRKRDGELMNQLQEDMIKTFI